MQLWMLLLVLSSSPNLMQYSFYNISITKKLARRKFSVATDCNTSMHGIMDNIVASGFHYD